MAALCTANIGKVATVMEQLYGGFSTTQTGYMEICSVCVLTQDTLVQRKIIKRSKNVLIGQHFIQNNTSDDKIEQ